MQKPLPRSRQAYPDLVRKLDRAFSLYVRTRDSARQSSGSGVRCVTCGRWFEVIRMQAGHFIPRTCTRLRWDERNVRAQCWVCNEVEGGATEAFARCLGQMADELRSLRSFVARPRKDRMSDAIAWYENETKRMTKGGKPEEDKSDRFGLFDETITET